MKKIMFILAFAVMLSANAFAKTLNSKQTALRDNLYSFVKNEGFQPTIDSDGDIKFKYQGKNYFIQVSSQNASPMYVSLSLIYPYDETYTMARLSNYSYLSKVNDYKMCKLILNDNYFEISCSLFLEDASAFKNIFYKMLEIIAQADEDF